MPLVVLALTGLPAPAPALARVDAQPGDLQARVAAIRAGLLDPSSAARPGDAHPSGAHPSLLAQANNWTNWPKWSKWSNWANK